MRRGILTFTAVASLLFFGATPATAGAETENTEPEVTVEVEQQVEVQEDAAPEPEAAPAPPAPPAPEPESSPPQATKAQPAPAPVVTPEPVAGPDPAPAPAPQQSTSQNPPASEEESPASLAVEEDNTDPPFIRWRVVDALGNPQQFVTFNVQGSKNTLVADDGNDSQWANAITADLTDNTGQTDYVGLDLDPAVGVFMVKELVDERDPARTHEIVAGETYRIQADKAPERFTVDPNEWDELRVTTSLDEITFGYELQESSDDPSEEDSAGGEEVEGQEPVEENLEENGIEADALDEENSDLLMPMALGPDGPGGAAIDPPYVYWNVTDANGDLLAGATFQLQRRNNNWGSSTTVTDNTGQQNYSGLDRDPDPGEFVVTHLDNGDAIATSRRYRVQQTAAPSGYTLTDTSWNEMSGSGQTPGQGQWVDGTHNFGTWINSRTGVATIVVKVGGDRTGTSGVGNLAEVVLHLQNGNNNGPNGVRPDNVSGNGDGWAKCVSNLNGECVFEVPNTGFGGSNRNNQYWVVQESVPAGWFMNTSLRVGDGIAPGSATPYQFRTGQLQSGNVYRSGTDFMASASDYRTSSGIWQQSRVNPGPVNVCGVDLALVLDLSGSVENYVTNLRSAANTFTDALVGTQSRMALFSFSTGSPALNASQNYPTLTSVATQAQADSFKARYASWTANGGTNWDRGLAAPAAANTGANHYQVVVVITDGNPTYYGSPAQGPGNTNRLIEIEQGIFSANALKAQGTRIIAFGVGAGAVGTAEALNLQAISGTTKHGVGVPLGEADYYQTTDYEAVGETLRALALRNCENNLTVTKMVVPNTAPEGSIEGAAPAVAGWEFTASSPSAGVTLPVTTQVTENDGTGTVEFPLEMPSNISSGEVTITETQQTGYTLQPVEGQHAVCRNLVTEQPVIPTSNPENGFRVSVPNGQSVNCIVYNRAPDETSTVKVNKTWQVFDGQGGSTSYLLPGDEGSLPAGLNSQLTLTGPDGAAASNQDWGAVRANYKQNDSVTIGENSSINTDLLPYCVIDSSQLVPGGTYTGDPVDLDTEVVLAGGPNEFEVLNKVTCTSQITLVKDVVNEYNGAGTVNDWTLTATGTTTGVTGKTGEAPITNRVVVPGNYVLSETGMNGYTPSDWVCEESGGSLGVVDDTVTVALGTHVTCTITNTDKPGAVSWNKVAAVNGELLGGAEWEISTPAGTTLAVDDCVEEPCEGLDQDPAAGQFLLEGLDWGEHTVTETQAPPGYAIGEPFTFTVNAENAGTTIEYGNVENDQQPGVALPLTGGLSSDTFTIGGLSIAMLAALLGAAYIVLGNRRRHLGVE